MFAFFNTMLQAAELQTVSTESAALETIASEVAEQISEDLDKVNPTTAFDVLKNHFPSILNNTDNIYSEQTYKAGYFPYE